VVIQEEIEYWRARDPINLYKDLLIREYILDIKDIEKIRKVVEEKIDKALEFAENSPEPKIEDTYEDLYVTTEVPR
jgi:pyruvate dehydrogenase E1 component alpha subunit